MRFFLLLGFALAGCAAQPVIEPPPRIIEVPQIIRPEVPATLFTPESPPVIPAFSGPAPVADYMVQLWSWGADGWAQLAAVQKAIAAPAPLGAKVAPR